MMVQSYDVIKQKPIVTRLLPEVRLWRNKVFWNVFTLETAFKVPSLKPGQTSNFTYDELN